jgi:predicted lipoprotein
MKPLKYIITVVVVLFIGYNSVYFRKLDEVKASLTAKEFNPAQYAKAFWNDKLQPYLGKAIEITQLTKMLTESASKTFENYSHALGIGNLRYFLVKGKGIIQSINEDDITVTTQPDSSKQEITIATEYIFGNAVRDATGLVNINDFSNTMDFNNVSAELNKMIREKVLPPFKSVAKKGSVLEFTGAIELNKEHFNLQKIEIIPVELKLVNQ